MHREHERLHAVCGDRAEVAGDGSGHADWRRGAGRALDRHERGAGGQDPSVTMTLSAFTVLPFLETNV